MLDAEQIAYLQTAAGRSLLAHSADLPEDTLTRLTRLRRSYSPEAAAAAVELLDLRRRAAPEFSRAKAMYFTAEGLEQSSGEAAARWRAARFPAGAMVLDLTCGIGGDTAQLAKRGPVLAFDRNAAAAACARANALVYGVADSVSVARADATRLRLVGDALFLDPSRRVGGRRVRDPRVFNPPLSFVMEALASVPHGAVKLSPAMDDADLDGLGGRLEFVSDRGECKEAIVWFGAAGPEGARRATVLPAGVSLEADPDAPPAPIEPPGAWLFEPDPAVIRAHLIAEVAQLVGGARLDDRIAYLTCAEQPRSPFGTPYRIVEWLPFSLARIQRRLRDLGARVVAVKRRGVPMETLDIERKLPPCGPRPVVIVLTRMLNRPVALLCEERENTIQAGR